ncbi:chloramphenicol acetyltransferase [Aestuariicoccus sp. KMU-90]|uniref:Chloramphenicol acetyltransferase n=1 Tax=Thetidibacter halocola TaxID=2827239 RepID=A0A8J7WC68_9RHOB|nr:chloramphenicol acetyltransferase [Thetidibacter halocola]
MHDNRLPFRRLCRDRPRQPNPAQRIRHYSYCDRFANIAAIVRVGATDHPLHTPACHHFLYRSLDYWDDADIDEDFLAHRRSRRARIGHDTWIGHGAMIKPQVTLGDGAVVASGAVVTRDVARYMIVAGTPDRVLRPRQPPEIAECLVALAWWDWSLDALRMAPEDFRELSAEAFLDRHDG